jgi:hypothetical protein
MYLLVWNQDNVSERVTLLGHIILIPDQEIDMSPHSDTLS